MSNNYCCIRKPHEQSKTSFGVPKIESERIKWEERLGMTLKKTHRVCLQHFKETDVISKWESGKGINKYSICLKRFRLKDGALPSIENRKDVLNETVCETTENINNALVTSPNFNDTPLETTLITSPELKRRKISEAHSLFQVIFMALDNVKIPPNWLINKYSYLANQETKEQNKTKKNYQNKSIPNKINNILI